MTIASQNLFEEAMQARRMSMTLSLDLVSEWRVWAAAEVMWYVDTLFEDAVLRGRMH